MLVRKHCITCATRDMTLHKRNPNVFYLLNDLCICISIKNLQKQMSILETSQLMYCYFVIHSCSIHASISILDLSRTITRYKYALCTWSPYILQKKHIYGGTKILCLFIYNLSIRSISYIFFYKQMHKLSWIKCKHVNNTYFCLKEKKKTQLFLFEGICKNM